MGTNAITCPVCFKIHPDMRSEFTDPRDLCTCTTGDFSTILLSTIADKLPTTADGTPVIPQIDHVWHPSDMYEGQSKASIKDVRRLVIKRFYKGKGTQKLGDWVGHPETVSEYIRAGVHECYSSPELALQAKVKQLSRTKLNGP